MLGLGLGLTRGNISVMGSSLRSERNPGGKW